jgi:ATP-dependent protease HslVU (ClpYQ) peptidase subunit
MSCIVGIAERGKVWIGADSWASNGNSYVLTRDTGKIFRCGPMLIAHCGGLRAGQVMRHLFTPKPFEQGDDPVRYLVADVAVPLRELLKEHGLLCADQERIKDGDAANNSMLIGIAGRLFICQDNFQIEEYEDSFAAHGCGSDLARGALSVLSLDIPPDKRIILALEATARFDNKVGPPFIVDSI